MLSTGVDLLVLRYIEANPLRARLVQQAEDYPWSSDRMHGCGEARELGDRLAFMRSFRLICKCDSGNSARMYISDG